MKNSALSIDNSNDKLLNTKFEEDKTKALKMLDFYKNSLNFSNTEPTNDAKLNDSKTNTKTKISSAEIYLTKNILINDDLKQQYSDSDYYEISKQTNDNDKNNKKRQSDEPSSSTTTNTNTSKTSKTTATISITNSGKVKHLSSDEEILCDLEVASYFDDKKIKNSDEDSFYYEKDSNQYENNSDCKSKSSNNEEYNDDLEIDDQVNDVLDDVIDDELDEEEEEDEDSTNLEFLVRQLAAEATLSLKGKKIINTYNYDNPITNTTNKDYTYNDKACVLKNKIFNCSINDSQKFINNNAISDEEEELIYDLESNFGLNDFIKDVYPNEKLYKKNSIDSKVDIGYCNKYEDDYDYDYNGSYSKSDTSESLNGNKTSTFNFNILNGEANINSKYISSNNKGFSSLRNKSKPNIYNYGLSNQQNIYDKKQLEKKLFQNQHKRSSSSTSCQQSHIVKLINHQQNNQRHLNQKSKKENENFNNSIKIEKKIRLNYNRPQNFNSILNFGTLC